MLGKLYRLIFGLPADWRCELVYRKRLSMQLDWLIYRLRERPEGIRIESALEYIQACVENRIDVEAEDLVKVCRTADRRKAPQKLAVINGDKEK